MNQLAKISASLETYRVHDSVVSLIGYKCGMVSGLLPEKSQLAVNLRNISTQISNARVILRLFDDYSMLTYTLTYGLGKSEKNIFIRLLTILGNLSSHVYYIAEHIAYFADNKIIKVDSGIYWLVSLLAWLISILTQIICNLIYLYKVIKTDENLKKKTAKIRKYLTKSCIELYMKLFEDIFWLVNCIHWLPSGFLWSGKLSEFTSGLFGVLATIFGILSKLI